MAILNILFQGSYTIINDINYSKQKKNCSFTVSVFETSEKSVLFTEFMKTINGNDVIPEIESCTQKTPPEDAQQNSFWVVPQDAEGEWEEFKGCLAQRVFGATNEWHYSDCNGNTYFCKDSEKYIKASAPIQEVHVVAKREFDQFFNWEKVNADGILKCCYDYLKSLPFAANGVDDE